MIKLQIEVRKGNSTSKIGKITQNYLTASGHLQVLGGLIEGNATTTFNWKKKFLTAEANFDILDGLISTQTQFLINYANDFEAYLYGEAKVGIPDSIPIIGGATLGSGEVFFQYIDDGNFRNDYVAAWGNVFLLGTVGIQVYFDGSYNVIWKDEAQTIKNHAETVWQYGTSNKTLAGISQGGQKDPTNYNDTLLGSIFNDTISALNGNDLLLGQSGDDILNGGNGNDSLNGDDGADSLSGGSGNGDDRFYINPQAGGANIIEDFSSLQNNNDLINIDISTFNIIDRNLFDYKIESTKGILSYRDFISTIKFYTQISNYLEIMSKFFQNLSFQVETV